MGLRSFHQKPEPLLSLHPGEFGMAPGMRLGCQTRLALLLVLISPKELCMIHATTAPGVAPTLRTTSRTPCLFCNHATPRRRLRSSSSALPCGLMHENSGPMSSVQLEIQESIGDGLLRNRPTQGLTNYAGAEMRRRFFYPLSCKGLRILRSFVVSPRKRPASLTWTRRRRTRATSPGRTVARTPITYYDG